MGLCLQGGKCALGWVLGDSARADRLLDRVAAAFHVPEPELEAWRRFIAAGPDMPAGGKARITGVANFGVFATVEGIGGDGLLSVRDLGTEYFRFDEAARTLTGEHSGETYALGQRLQLRLKKREFAFG